MKYRKKKKKIINKLKYYLLFIKTVNVIFNNSSLKIIEEETSVFYTSYAFLAI